MAEPLNTLNPIRGLPPLSLSRALNPEKGSKPSGVQDGHRTAGLDLSLAELAARQRPAPRQVRSTAHSWPDDVAGVWFPIWRARWMTRST